jgi:hypothetical protein
MRVKSRLIAAVTTTVVLALLVACSEAATPAPTPTPPSQPPTPTPVSPEARQTAVEFAHDYRNISQEWDQFHTDFSQWRAGLAACDRSAAEVSLRDFASEFNDVLGQARNLPRSSATRSLSDQLIKAGEDEGEALRQLRDKWQPGNTSLFDALETQRSAAAAAQQEVLDKLNDLRESTDPTSLDDAKKFSQAFEQINDDWQQFHDSYSSLHDQQGDLSASEMSGKLSDLVGEFGDIVSAIGDLPSSDATDSMSEKLTEAADAEDEALKSVRDTFQSHAEASDGEGSSDGESSSSSSGDDPFATLNDLVTESDDVRDQVQKDLKAILEDTSAQKITDLDNFRQQYDVLVQQWNKFHQDYDEWRRTDGGCDLTEVTNRLSQFSLQFERISQKVGDLPRASFVRPMADTLEDAANREEEALRVLRNTWRPFATDAYRALDQERNNADRLRRQAEVGIQEMLDRFGIPASEI